MATYNLKNPAVKRLMREAEELKEPTEEYFAEPLEDNLFEWHFTIRGPPNTEFEGGIYHGRITLPPDYPMKPPSIILLTPNGRFETNKKICLSISGYHPESWQPSWSIRTALLAIIGFLPTHGNGAIGSLDYTPLERRQLALKSQKWKCSECGLIKDVLKKIDSKSFLNNSQEHDEGMETDFVLNENCAISESVSLLKDNDEIQTFPDEEENLSNSVDQQCENNYSFNIFEQSSDLETTSVLRNRHSISEQEEISTQSFKDEEIKLQRNVFSYLSLLVIWLLALMLITLVVRRIFYQ